MEKINLLILFGGTSNEHEVSILSTISILNEINSENYNIVKVGITKDGRWLMTDASFEEMKSGEWKNNKDNIPVTVNLSGTKKGLITYLGEEIEIDCVFIVMHGKNAEDGTMQGLFEIAQIPYVGPNVMASANAMDKLTGKIIADSIGVKQAKYYPLDRHKFASNPLVELENIKKYFDEKFPIFVKPANSGSSVGITKVHNERELFEGIKTAAEIDHRIVIEEAIYGREFEVAVLGNKDPKASRIGEIISANEIYDYEAKYLNENSRTRIVDDISESEVERIQKTAIDLYKAFSCRGLSRVDFFYTDKGEVVFNEINTLPGFTSISMYPQLWNDMGVSYSELIDKLIYFAMEEF